MTHVWVRSVLSTEKNYPYRTGTHWKKFQSRNKFGDVQRDQIYQHLFHHFGKNVKVFSYIESLFSIWQNFEPVLANFYAVFIIVNGQN